MAKKFKKILMLGSGALKIGEAGEFDYSGSQGLKALKEEGVRTVLLNPNIATIQTSSLLADEIYFLPVTPEFAEKVIRKEKPDGIVLSFGGQTALNCGLELVRRGVLKKYGVEILGTPVEAIELTEDREKFAMHLRKLGIPVPPSGAAVRTADALRIGKRIGFPVMVRAAFALGGQRSGVAHDMDSLRQLADDALAVSPQVLVEKYLHHYKEIEYEVVRDRAGNRLTICNMENMDPLGIHTGESVVVAPSQTLNNEEYHGLRDASLKIVESLGIIGECNVQFALNPKPRAGELDYYVIEVNARLSRSSALASKATGYPLAYVAAKLALGKLLPDVPNQITKVTTSFFEPALDYVVVKIPRWDIEKFRGAEEKIGSAMKSVGEVMAIGRTFEEALQKGVRMLHTGRELTENGFASAEILKYLEVPTPKRLFALAAAFRKNISIEKVHALTGIDPWFLSRIRNIVRLEMRLQKLSKEDLLRAKELGFSDSRLARITGQEEEDVRRLRIKWGIRPAVFQIDTLAGEVPAKTNYLYLTYNGSHNDVAPLGRKGVLVLGSGPYHIGSSVEFDWSAVHAAKSLSRFGRRSIVVNCNPETVSTDYDISDRLYFENVDLETVEAIYDFEKSSGVVVSVGGQTPNNLARAFAEHKIPVLGTHPADIDRAEDRNQFSAILDRLHIGQPEWVSASSLESVKRFARRVGYPVLVRPSYVLSGSAMSVCYNEAELAVFLKKATVVNREYPVTISKFMEEAKEVELDAVAMKGKIMVSAIAEHVEFAGVHSGDATIVFPARSLMEEETDLINEVGRKLAVAFRVTGPFNIQFLVKNGEVYVIEMNLRASRTFPLLSKATGVNFAEEVVASFFGKASARRIKEPKYTVVKSPQFSFARLAGADPILHVEMASTGEVAAFGSRLEEALLASIASSAGLRVQKKAILLSVGGDKEKDILAWSAAQLSRRGYKIYATSGTAEHLKKNGVAAISLKKAHEAGGPNVKDVVTRKNVDLVVNIPGREGGLRKKEERATSGYFLRRLAVDNHIPLITDPSLGRALLLALAEMEPGDIPAVSWKEYLNAKRRS